MGVRGAAGGSAVRVGVQQWQAAGACFKVHLTAESAVR